VHADISSVLSQLQQLARLVGQVVRQPGSRELKAQLMDMVSLDSKASCCVFAAEQCAGVTAIAVLLMVAMASSQQWHAYAIVQALAKMPAPDSMAVVQLSS
jgi:hypothetical protein